MTLLDPGTRDWAGAAILFAIALGCYVVLWAAARAGARADRQVAAIRFHTPNLAVSPYDQDLPVAHDRCEGPCGRTICRCHEDQRTDVLAVLCHGDAVAQGCGHGHTLCVECAPGECDECLTDLRCQGVLSQYVVGTFPTGGAA
jgi:hypothetical protein